MLYILWLAAVYPRNPLSLSFVMGWGLVLQFFVNRFGLRAIEIAREPSERDAQDVAMVKFATHSLTEPEP